MHVLPTLGEVLALGPLRRAGARVAAAGAALDRPVRWVHIAEVPDIARELSGGELVLTTGLGLPDDQEGLARYVDTLADVGAAGLAVELGRRWERLPQALTGRCERRALPLVALTRPTPFVAVTEAVHGRIVDAQVAELRATDEVHRTFTELSVEGADAAQVLREVARMAGSPVVLENLAHRVLAYDAAGQDPQALLERWEARSRAAAAAVAGDAGRTGHDAAQGWLVTAVGARGQDWGRLVLVLEGDGPPPARLAVVLERAASALALDRLVRRDEESLERRTHGTLLAGLLAHAAPGAEVALRARALGVPLEGRRLVGVVLRLVAPPGSPTGGSPAPRDVQERLRDLAEQAAAAARGAGVPALTAPLDAAAPRGVPDAVGMLLSLSARDREDDVLTALAAAVRARPDAGGVVVAAGCAVGAVTDARRSLEEAAQVADAALAQGGGAGRAYHRLPDVRVRGLLHLLRDDPRLQTYVERELGPLLAWDEAHGTALVAALGTYLAHGRNKSAAAEAAHLSRPAFYERLRKVEQVLGVDLDGVESCLSLHVALLALDAVRR
ncbi:PucR family transcriptional regulator [Vallicoccus soli]|uniref:PucR family transcriptional regulator n=1 Tax=Vallicoccus soli TaxID=2339232 RepID=A0A3A3Z4X0_9ACTN|nr:PucR family transcriptional regulator [Vallicoccus soli]